MTIETVIDWLQGHHIPVLLVAATLVWTGVCLGIYLARALWRWVAGRRPFDDLEKILEAPDNLVDPNKMVDRQYQGDQVSGIRKELLALDERVGKLEKPSLNINCPTTGNSFGIGGFRFLTPNASLGISSQPARYRVFRHESGSRYVCAHGVEVARRGRGGWEVPYERRLAAEFAANQFFPELSQGSPEYAEIVASFEAWKAAQ